MNFTDRYRSIALFCAAVSIIFLQAFRLPILPLGAGLDASFPYILNLGASEGARFGTDIVYTYGPLGYLLVIEDVGRNLVSGIAFWVLIYAAFCLSMTHFVVSQLRGWRVAIGVAAAATVATIIDVDRLLSCFVLLLLFHGYDLPKHRRLIIGLCGFIAAIGLLMKVTIGVGCIGAILASCLVPFNSVREIAIRFSIAIASTTATLLVAWTVLTGSLNGIGSYFYNSLQMSAGYTASMGVSRADEGTSLAIFLASMALLAVFAGLLPRWRNLHALAIIVPSVAIAWKHGVVRYDEHIFALVILLAFSTFCILISHLRNADGSRLSRSAGPPLASFRPAIGIIGSFAVVYLNAAALACADIEMPLKFAGGIEPVTNIFNIKGYRSGLHKISEKQLAGSKFEPGDLIRLGGQTADVYSFELGFVAANPRVQWHLKPVFQHFNAFTEHLDRLNAEFLQDRNAPAFLIMHHPNDTIAGVDGRHQLFDDPIAFVEVMRNYRTDVVQNDPSKTAIGLLKRAATPRSFGQPTTNSSELVRWNDPIKLPKLSGSEILRVKVDLSSPMSSKVKEAFFRLSPIYLVYVLLDGSEQRYRLMPPHLKDGVWISPLFENYSSLYAFLGEQKWAGPKVSAIRFESDNLDDYRQPFSISWETISCDQAAPCQPSTSRIFSAFTNSGERVPVLIRPDITAALPAANRTIQAIDVRLSTYGQLNKGTLTLAIVDKMGNSLADARLDASLVRDNDYAMFVYDRPLQLAAGDATLKLSYEPIGDGVLAAWKSSSSANDMDFRIYGD